MFEVHMLPADHGDCLWLNYGDEANPKHILIDAGTPGTWPRLKAKINAERARNNGQLHFELFVITHIDADHIGGSIKFLQESGSLGVTFGEVWFNGWHHLDNETPDVLGAVQGEALTAEIEKKTVPWNANFGRRAVMVPDTGALPRLSYAGMDLTLLSPTFAMLQKLKPDWEKEVVKAGLKPGGAVEPDVVEEPSDQLGDDVEDMANVKFDADKTKPNGSSIAFIAEHDGKRVLFGADAHVDVLLASLKRGPLSSAEKLPLDLFKVSHHGSRKNLSRELVEAVPAKRYLISTSGAIFKHPNQEAIARIAVFGPEEKALEFNYRTQFNEEWDSSSRKLDWGLTTRYGDAEQGLLVRL